MICRQACRRQIVEVAVTGVRLTRQSVAMGDDAWAPHDWQFTVAPGTTLGELVQIAIDDRYLATISGSGRPGSSR